LYEMVFVLRSKLDEEGIKATKKKMQDFIERNEGKVEKFIDLGKRKLTYEVEGEEEGYFMRALFDINSIPTSELLRWLKAQDEVIRVVITKRGAHLLKEKIKERREANVSSE